jgi:hypothetical protein
MTDLGVTLPPTCSTYSGSAANSAANRSERQPRVYQEAYVYRFPARAALSLPAGATSICTSPASPDGDACSVRLERGLFIK